ncbi:MAG: hypothetical protein Q9167_006039 [Letrouitia subvulpina]
MRALFEDASAVLQRPQAPTANHPVPAKSLRRPFSTTDCLKPGLVPVGSYGLVQETGKRKAGASPELCVSSGFPDNNSPPRPPLPQSKTKEPVNRSSTSPMKTVNSPLKDSQAIRYPDLRSQKSTSGLSPTHFSNQHQIQGPDVETWLENVPDSPRPSSRHRMAGSYSDIASMAPGPIELSHRSKRSSPARSSGYRLPATISSDKENISPSKIPIAIRTTSPVKSVVLYPRLPNATPGAELGIKKSPSRFSSPLVKNKGDSPGAAVRCLPPLTPHGHLANIVKRKRSPPGLGPNMSSPQNREPFVIHDEESAFPSAEISPNVECHRKGHGPRRERCASYWDKDIFPEAKTTPTKTSQLGSKKEEAPGEGQGAAPSSTRDGKGRAVLVETAASDELTTAKPFSKGLERHKFDFESLFP